jgi:sugar phosphate isomerase/epimerase
MGPGQAIGLEALPDRAEELWRRAGEHRLRVCGLSIQDERALELPEDGFEHVLELAVAAHAPHLRVFAPPYRGGDVAEELQRLRGVLAERTERARRRGLTLLVEPAPATLIPGPEWLATMGLDLPPDQFGAVYDPGSLVMEGQVRPRLAVAVLGTYLRHVHVKDVVPERMDGGWRWTNVRPGSGLVAWPEVLEALAEASYGGWLVIDHLSGEAGAARLAEDVAALRGLLEAIPANGGMASPAYGPPVGGER